MSVEVGSAVGYLDLDITKWKRNSEIAKRDMEDLNRKSSSLRGNVGRLGSSFTNTGSRLSKFGGLMTEHVTKPLLTAGAAVGTFIGAVGGIGLKTASDLEQYRNTLNVVMKDSKKAADLMSWAVDFANKTPFETNEVVDATVKLQSYGLTAKDVMVQIGDMASVMNKPLDQAVEAVADAQTGELERLKEFGITKKMIVEEGNKMMAGVELVNQKGQIVNQEKFNEALFGLMKERYQGGMEIQSTTLKGLWSTVTGMAKNTMANIMGVTNTGEIVDGGLFDKLKKKLSGFTDMLTKWQEDGTLDRFVKETSDTFGTLSEIWDDSVWPVLKQVGGLVGDLIGWFADLSPESQKNILKFIALGVALGPVLSGFGWILSVGGNLATILSGVGTAAGVSGAAGGMSTLNKALAVAFGPAGLVVVGIGLLALLAKKLEEAGPKNNPYMWNNTAEQWTGTYNNLMNSSASSQATVGNFKNLERSNTPAKISTVVEHKHAGTITVKGIDNKGELKATMKIIMKDLTSQTERGNRRTR